MLSLPFHLASLFYTFLLSLRLVKHHRFFFVHLAINLIWFSHQSYKHWENLSCCDITCHSPGWFSSSTTQSCDNSSYEPQHPIGCPGWWCISCTDIFYQIPLTVPSGKQTEDWAAWPFTVWLSELPIAILTCEIIPFWQCNFRTTISLCAANLSLIFCIVELMFAKSVRKLVKSDNKYCWKIKHIC